MAFDFGNGQTGFEWKNDGGGGGGFDWSHPESGGHGFGDEGGFGGASGFGGTPSNDAGFGSGWSDSMQNDPFSSSGGAFQSTTPGTQMMQPTSDGTPLRPQMSYAKPRKARRPRSAPVNIPWNYIIPAVLIIAAIVLCVVFRDVITEFLAQLLTWAIVILVIYIIIRLVFGGRRRR